MLSRLRKASRSGIRYLCNGTDMPEVVLNRKAKTPENRTFLTADAGDLLAIAPPEASTRLAKTARLSANDLVETVSEKT